MFIYVAKRPPELYKIVYNEVSANVMICVPQMGESESGQMVLEKVK